MKRACSIILALPLLFLLACGSSSHAPVTVSITPSTSTLLVNQYTKFNATVTGTSNTAVAWSVQETNGGGVINGFYTAPWTNGTYHVVATSVADPTKSATAKVSVSAVSLFIEELPNGNWADWSATPILATLGPDGTFSTTSINDPATSKPMEVPKMGSAFLSSDGTKLVFEKRWSDGGVWYWDLFTINSDGTGLTQLTFNSSYSRHTSQFSPDGKQIIYSDGYNIRIMNADGSNDHSIYGSYANTEWGMSASFSPDGTKIVAGVGRIINSEFWDGIATMNADGTNLVQLTGQYDPACNGWDEMPTFTNDGKQISFSRVCRPSSGDWFESVYIMNTDGTNITKLHGDNTSFISGVSRAFADRLVFSTNVDYPGTNGFEMYSIALDGSNLTRLTNNLLYDGFTDAWMNWYSSPSASERHALSPAEERMEHLRRLQERRHTH